MSRPAFLLFAAAAAACAPAPTPPVMEPEPGPMTPAVTATTSYLRHVQPLIERSCKSCHTTGGVAPLALDTPDQVIPLAAALWNAISNNRMPPFFADRGCNSYLDDPRFSDAEKALFQKWVEEGAPRGDPADERHAMTPQLPVVRHDVELSIGAPFDVRKMNDPDVYRCFVMNPANAADLLVKGVEVLPQNKAVVHHLLAYVTTEAVGRQLEALDAADTLPGYTCGAGGVGVQGASQNLLAVWVPGQFPTRFPANTALALPANSRISVQIHYNNLALADPAVSPFDQTAIALETAPPNTMERAVVTPVVDRMLDIAPGDANAVETNDLRLPMTFRPITIYRAMGHAHGLASRITLEHVKADGTKTCVLDNTPWDFNWQRDYTLVKPVRVGPGDTLRITCRYNNSQANQPMVGGVQQTPRRVTWGEGTFDEMCMTYLTFGP
jgi:hypothetical protein